MVKLKQPLKRILICALWVAIAAYVVAAFSYSRARQRKDVCRQISVTIANPSARFITPETVKGWYADKKLIGKKLDDINTFEIENIALERAYVKSASAYVSKPGKLNIEVAQRTPVIRLCSSRGHNIYLSADWCVLPFQRQWVARVPLVTGNIPLPFNPGEYGPHTALEQSVKKRDENWAFLTKLINFVKFLEEDSFWSSFIVQVNVTGDMDVELVPRAGNHVVLLGDPGNYESRMKKLLSFYQSGKGEWEQYRHINIKYRNQVICSK